MNAPSLSELRTAPGRDAADEKMEQIRELLIGSHVRSLEARLAALEARISDNGLRLREIETSLSRQVDALSARLEALAAETGAHRLNSFEELSRGVAALGDQIRKIARS